MRHALFKHYLLSGASFGAVDVALGASRPKHDDAPQSFLARVRLWLQLIFGGSESVAIRHVTCVTSPPPNRHKARLRRRKLPLQRRPCALSHHFLHRYGYTRFREWIYNRTLTPRVRWCFQDWNWRWAPSESFADCAEMFQIEAICAAPLHPD